MVVVQKCENSINNSMVRLSQTNVHAQNQVYNEIDKYVKLRLEKRTNRFLPAQSPVFDAIALRGSRRGRSRFWEGREVWLHELLTLLGREFVAMRFDMPTV